MLVKDILYKFPKRFDSSKIDADAKVCFHFEMEGEGNYTVSIAEGSCEVVDGFVGESDCKIRSKAEVFYEVLTGKRNAMTAFMMGKIKVDNPTILMKYAKPLGLV